MTLRDRVRGASPFELVARFVQMGLAGLPVYAVVVGEWGLLINGTLALALTFVPDALRSRYDHEPDPRLQCWIALAALGHGLGVLGPYSVQSGVWQWYDQAAHAVSGSLVAGIGYALIAALDRHSRWLQFPGWFRFVFTLCLVMAVGVAWEVVEFAAGTGVSTLGGQKVLSQYGLDDVVHDILFNTLAAAVVALWGTGYFSGMAALFTRQLSGGGDP